MTERKLQRNRRGFTLTEVLLALAILIILLALAMIPISRHQRSIRQSELDSKAETIYLAAQNRLSQLQASGEYDPKAENRFAPAICNRLDRGTEGLVIAAKKYTALRDMNEIIRNDWMKKEYLTITIGAPPAGRHVAWLQHSEKGNKVRIHAHESEGYKKIITDVTVIRCIGPFALCRIGLITGRTHQIRAHLAYLGHPVLGDIKYGNRNMNEKTGFKTQALCAQRLTFGNIPEENTLHYLSGRVIKLADPEIVKQFDALERKPGQE